MVWRSVRRRRRWPSSCASSCATPTSCHGQTRWHRNTERAALEAQGITIAPLDLMIAAHALAVGATLVSADQSLSQIDILKIENWQ